MDGALQKGAYVYRAKGLTIRSKRTASPTLNRAPAPLNKANRQSKSITDPITAHAVGVLSLALAAGGLFVGSHSLLTGCIGLMRGRHGPSVQQCAPEISYWVATCLSLLLGLLLVAVGWRFLRLARSGRGARASRR